MIEVERIDKTVPESMMDKSDILDIALAIQGIALGCPKPVLNRIEEYLKEIETIVGKYAGVKQEGCTK